MTGHSFKRFKHDKRHLAENSCLMIGKFVLKELSPIRRAGLCQTKGGVGGARGLGQGGNCSYSDMLQAVIEVISAILR